MYIHTDGLGSPVAKSDKFGNLISGSRTRYEPYGATAAGATPTIGFTGHVNDANTGLVYMQQRYYDPYAGRFLSTDPVLTDADTGRSFNRYIYANNNPFRYIDPDGRDGIVGELLKAVIKTEVKAAPKQAQEAAKAAAKQEAKEGVKDGVKAAGEEATKQGGRNANKLKPVQEAEGPHSVIKRDAAGNTTNTATYTPNPKNPTGHDEVKRVDVTGKGHRNTDGTKVDTPHVHEAGGTVRPARPEELPKK